MWAVCCTGRAQPRADPASTRLSPSPACRVTVLGSKGPGGMVNIEVEAQTQAIVDTVERVLGQYLTARGLQLPSL